MVLVFPSSLQAAELSGAYCKALEFTLSHVCCKVLEFTLSHAQEGSVGNSQ
jgi:hypothetical protein